MDLKKLSVDVQCLLSASARINSYKRAVEELTYNSLDAESTSIAIRIKIQDNWIQVIDNGSGIKKSDFNLLGERFATSKLLEISTLKAAPSKYGYQGQALANIIQLSKTVKITSRCGDSDETWTKIFLEGRKDKECLKASMRPSKGTTVEIHGFLYNLKIQKKYVNAFNELQDIKAFLEQLLLVFNNVSISLRDDSENEIIFQMHKNRDIYQTLKSLFDINTSDFKELQIEKNEYKVKAFIGIDSLNTKKYHWTYLNNKCVKISNLNKLIANKFANPKRTKNKKLKTAGPYKEENSSISVFVPFYFLFITCPYFEYDIMNSEQQTAIEFKNWTQINSLLEKLVTIYNDDIKVLNVQKYDNHNHVAVQVTKNVEETRNEVKRIMEKILEKPHKTCKTSQMKNGIKGKQVKRRRRKLKTNISLTHILPPKSSNTPYKDLKNLSIKANNKYKNIVFKEVIPTYCNSTIQPKQIKSKTKGNKNFENPKSYLKCKCNKHCDNLIEVFKNMENIHNIKRRCSDLLYGAKYLSNSKNCEEIKLISFNQMGKANSYLGRKAEKYITKKNRISMNVKSLKNELQRYEVNKKPVTEKIRSYDLLQTVLKSQPGLYDQKSAEVEVRTINKSNVKVQQQAYAKDYYFTNKLTFDSHKYNSDTKLMEKKLRRNVQFISKQSSDNNTIVYQHKGGNCIKTGKVTKHHRLLKTNNNKKHNFTNFHKLLEKYEHDDLKTPFSINISEIDIIEFSKQIRNQVMTDMNILHDSEGCDNNRFKSKPESTTEQLNFGINMNIERTFTILMDSFNNPSQAFNMQKNSKTIIDETVCYTNLSCHDPIYNNLPDFTSTARELNIYEPLEICEAIINSPKDIKHDSISNLNIIPRQDSPYNIKNNNCIRASSNVIELANDNIINKSQKEPSTKNKKILREDLAAVEFEQNKTKNGKSTPNNGLAYQIKDKYEKVGTKEIENSSLDNFNLNARLRFVPKGMSQIFKPCFPKRKNSCNLDTEYYENKIYNNFMEQVAIHSEIFEPKVQNLKEMTCDVQKANEKLKKQNANLIFGTDSLKGAKVVLGQVDCKFIAAIIQDISQRYKSPKYLVLFDQHAVHERINLEKNLSYYFMDGNWKRFTIDQISLKASTDDILYLHNHKDKFTRFGLEWVVLNNSEILVNAIPEAINGKHSRPMETIVRTVKDLISELIYAIIYLKGNVSLYPQSIMNLVFSEACRYAIKFGDKLSVRECIELIATLAECKTPFQCAHGRPVMAVMLELNNERIDYKANMDKISQFRYRLKK